MSTLDDSELDQLFNANTLDPTAAAATLLLTAMVKGPALGERALRAAARRGVPRDTAIEVALQVYLFAGFPRSITMLAVVADAWPAAEAAEEKRISPDDVPHWRDRGEKLFRKIYDKNADRVLADLLRFHPELRDWIFVDAYGKVLARPGLDARVRELAAVGALAASGDFRQLSSHARGAMHCGASRDDVFAALRLCRSLIGDAALAKALEIATKALPSH